MYINVFPTLYYVFSIYLVSKNMQDPWRPHGASNSGKGQIDNSLWTFRFSMSPFYSNALIIGVFIQMCNDIIKLLSLYTFGIL